MKKNITLRWKTALLLLIIPLFLLLGGRNFFTLLNKTLLPLFHYHDHFSLDFNYFYTMGKIAFTNPADLYKDPQLNGTMVLMLKRQVFHPYPPPAALLFRLFSFISFGWAHCIWSLSIYLMTILTCILFFYCLKKEYNYTTSTIAIPLLLSCCSAPVFHDSTFGNANSFILLLCMFFYLLFIKKKFFHAGLILAIVFWIKLYPILLLITVIFTKRKLQLLSGFFTGASCILLLALLVIPSGVFKEYFLEIAPAITQQTITHAFNQSITACLTRLTVTPDLYFDYDYTLTPDWVRSVNYFFFATGISLILTLKIINRPVPLSAVIAFACALIPLVTPIGWGYTFVFVYPALLMLYITEAKKSRVSFLLYILCWLAFATPSYHRIEQFDLPWQLRLLYYSRYTLSTLFMLGWITLRMYSTQKQPVADNTNDNQDPIASTYI